MEKNTSINLNRKSIIDVAVIGLGVGKYHVENLIKIKSINKIYIYDTNKDKYKFFSNKKIIKVKKYEDILANEKISLVCVASYDHFHYKQIIDCLKYKKDVFAEKPICLSLKEFTHIKEVAKKKKKKVSCNFVLRSQREFKNLKKLIAGGVFGNIYYMEADYNYGRLKKLTHGWRSKVPNYSVTLGGGIHMLDLVLWITKFKPKDVKSFSNDISTKNSDFRYKDFATTLIKFSNKSILKLTSNFGCVYPHSHFLRIYGTKCSYFYDGLSQKFIYKRNLKNIKKNVVNKNINKKEILKNFIKHLVEKKKSKNEYININEIEKTMKLGFMVDKSIKI